MKLDDKEVYCAPDRHYGWDSTIMDSLAHLNQFLLFTDVIHQSEKTSGFATGFCQNFLLWKNHTSPAQGTFPFIFLSIQNCLHPEGFIIFMTILLNLRGDELLGIFARSIIKLVLSVPWCCMLNFDMIPVTAETSETQRGDLGPGIILQSAIISHPAISHNLTFHTTEIPKWDRSCYT